MRSNPNQMDFLQEPRLKGPTTEGLDHKKKSNLILLGWRTLLGAVKKALFSQNGLVF